MSRTSSDELAADGTILNGFDYNVQVWVEDGIIQACGHPQMYWQGGRARGPCCNASLYAGRPIIRIPGHEVRGKEA